MFESRSAPASPESSRRRGFGLLWALVGGLALGVRIFRLDHFSYWLDEILQAYTIRESWTGLWRSLSWQGLHAPLDYAALRVLESLGPSDAVRRLPAAIWGVGCVLCLGFLVARRAGRVCGFAASALLALAPYHVHYSQEVRPYSLGLFLLVASLLCLERSLERPRVPRLLLLFVACTATIYALYLAGLLLAMVAPTLLLEDAFDPDPRRRLLARRFLLWSPLFASAVAIAYSPWWPVFLRALRSRPMSSAPDFGWERVTRLFSYFGFGPRDWAPLGIAGVFFLALSAFGGALALRTPRLRFLLVWAFGGLAVLEGLEHRKPTFDSIFHWLPAGLGLTALAGVGLGWFLSGRAPLPAKLGVVALLLAFDGRSLAVYFREGRPDWRPLAAHLRQTPPDEKIYVANQYTQLCLGYYVVGPDWLCCKQKGQRPIVNLDGDVSRLASDRDPRHGAWLALPGGHTFDGLLAWSAEYPSTRFPTAEGEGGVILRYLRPSR